LFKLYYRSPRSLPETIWKNAHEMGINLDLLLRGIIGLELIIAGIMFFSRRFSRPTAIALLVIFCLILLNEIRIGAASCGCLGTIVMPPETMLYIDLPLLIGVLVFRPRPPEKRPRPAEVGTKAPREGASAFNPWPAVFALAWVLFSFGLSFGVPDVKAPQVAINPGPGDDEPAAGTDHRVVDSTGGTAGEGGEATGDGGAGDNTEQGEEADHASSNPGAGLEGPNPPPPAPNQGPLPPPSYYVFEVDEYAGKRWDQLPFTRYLRRQPADVNTGRRYVVLYNPTCDHCYELLLTYFSGALPAPTTVIAIPEMKTGWSEEEPYPMPCEACEKLELPLGCDWLVLPPVVIALENGVVKCAKEGEDPDEPECLLWH
jgi:hypothetical protein